MGREIGAINQSIWVTFRDRQRDSLAINNRLVVLEINFKFTTQDDDYKFQFIPPRVWISINRSPTDKDYYQDHDYYYHKAVN